MARDNGIVVRVCNSLALLRRGLTFGLWKDADSDIPILKQAKIEYAGINKL